MRTGCPWAPWDGAHVRWHRNSSSTGTLLGAAALFAVTGGSVSSLSLSLSLPLFPRHTHTHTGTAIHLFRLLALQKIILSLNEHLFLAILAQYIVINITSIHAVSVKETAEKNHQWNFCCCNQWSLKALYKLLLHSVSSIAL